MKLSKELLKEIYDFVDENLKAKIENEVPEMKPTLEVGKWYTPLNEYKGKAMVCIVNTDDFYNVGYGFDFKGNYVTDNYSIIGNTNPKSFRLATPEKVKTAIKNELIKLGFIKGCSFYSVLYQRKCESTSGNLDFSHFNEDFNWIIYIDGEDVFRNGKFATLIKEKELLIEKLNELKEKANELEKQINEL